MVIIDILLNNPTKFSSNVIMFTTPKLGFKDNRRFKVLLMLQGSPLLKEGTRMFKVTYIWPIDTQFSKIKAAGFNP
jgi:hypothetical protein